MCASIQARRCRLTPCSTMTGPSLTSQSAKRSTRIGSPWRVWVSGGRGEEQLQRSESDATAALRSEVAERGVERVLQYEKEHGRWPLEMPPNNPGFDVESRTEPGRPPTRLIEVKSL